MSSFADLLAKSKKKNEVTEVEAIVEKEKQITNPFSALRKTLTAVKDVPDKTEEVVLEILPAKPITTTGDPMRDEDFNAPEQVDGIDKDAIKTLKENMDILIQSITHKELVTSAIRIVLIHLKKYPFLKDILLPEDCQIMVRALRESYGSTITKKNQRRDKKDASSAEVDAVVESLSDLDFKI